MTENMCISCVVNCISPLSGNQRVAAFSHIMQLKCNKKCLFIKENGMHLFLFPVRAFFLFSAGLIRVVWLFHVVLFADFLIIVAEVLMLVNVFICRISPMIDKILYDIGVMKCLGIG